MNSRLKKIRAKLVEKNIDNLLITALPNIFYATGFTGSSAIAFISDNSSFLITDGRYTTQAKSEVEEFDIIIHSTGKGLYQTLSDELNKLNIKTIYFDAANITFRIYQALTEKYGLTIKPVDNVIEELRFIKDLKEIELIQNAINIAIDSFNDILPLTKPGVKELDLAAELQFRFTKHGATGTGFPIIVASGERSALPHGRATNKIIEYGDIITFDFSAVVNGYCSDLTRTFVVGNASDKAKKFYDIIHEAQKRAILGMKPGMTGKQIDAFARDYIKEQGYGPLFDHGLGHSIGIEVHEAPSVSSMSEAVFKEGMIFTIEPGIYEEGFGGVRIEDIILLESNGAKVLSEHLPKDFKII